MRTTTSIETNRGLRRAGVSPPPSGLSRSHQRDTQVVDFLGGFDAERRQLRDVLDDVTDAWGRFQQRGPLELAAELPGSAAARSLVSSELELVRRDLEATEFTVGIVGLAGRGKSTLLNGLAGLDLSPVGAGPLPAAGITTTVPIHVTYAERPAARVHLADGATEAVAVDEAHHLVGRPGVAAIERRVPVAFLRSGTRLVDMPGIEEAAVDEVDTRHTLQALDRVDAGIVVFGGVPEPSCAEARFLEAIVSRALPRTFLVCNMTPGQFHDPAVRAQLLDRMGSRMVEVARVARQVGEVRIYPVCALEAWQAQQHGDETTWRRSGADRLLRDIDQELSGRAGRAALTAAVGRVVRTVEVAKAEVAVRQRLLDDPERLGAVQAQLDADLAELGRRFEEVMARSVADLAPLRMRIRGLVLAPFTWARREIVGLSSVEELHHFSARFRRELDVAVAVACRQFGDRFARIVEQLQTRLQEQFAAVVTDLSPRLPQIRLSSNELVATAVSLQALDTAERRTRTGARLGALGGGALGALATAFEPTIGPVALLAGTLGGWRISSNVVAARTLRRARADVSARLDEIAEQQLGEVDRQIDAAVEGMRAAFEARRSAFTSDLHAQVEVVRQMGQEPAQLEAHRREAARLLASFDDAAVRARGVLVDGPDRRVRPA